ncbi:MAG: STAS domain-containing protein [Candidatus Zixiibacteriota bacterium]
MENIRISLSEGGHNREVSEIRVDGVIDTLTASELEQVFDSLLRRGRYRIVVDLAGVDYISSAGWGIFISHIKDVRDNAGDVKLANMVPDVREIFELLEFDKILQAHNSVEEAVAKFVSPAGTQPKKKESGTKIEIVDQISDSARSLNPLETTPTPPAAESDLELFALRMLKSDPFITIAEIRREFSQQGGGLNAGWWRVFLILRRHRLLMRRSRFRYAWGRT